MTIVFILQNIGAAISFGLGFIAIFWPAKTETFVSIQSLGKEGNSEVRATYGGFFLGIALFALIAQNSTIFLVLGIGWLSASLIRLFTLFIGFYTSKNLMGVIFEAIIGSLCATSAIF
jgi:hypothetical protein